MKDKCFNDFVNDGCNSNGRLFDIDGELPVAVDPSTCACVRESQPSLGDKWRQTPAFRMAFSTSSLKAPLILTSIAPVNSCPTAPPFTLRGSILPSLRLTAFSCLVSTSFRARNGSCLYIHFMWSGAALCSSSSWDQYSRGPCGRTRFNWILFHTY